ncbi:cytochrome C oxidase subunit II [Candidatus Pacearchaeota archaeon]|nr:cytochrome C oxidase subunit II [Candidatus Pacearchaeota archaeon]
MNSSATGLGAVILVLIIFLGVVIWVMNQGVPQSSEDYKGLVSSKTQSSTSVEPRIINVKAERFTYAPSLIKVKKGEKVRLVVENVDTAHGIMISELSVSGIDSVEFIADKAGTYEFRCPTMCGSGHREMKGKLIVEE